MIELPEAKVLAKQLQRIVTNKKIINVIQGLSVHKFAFFNKEIPIYEEFLLQKQITFVTSHGGHVELTIDEYKLTLSDGVNIRYFTHPDDIPKKHQLLLQFEDATFLVFSVQMYGMMFLFKEGQFDNFYYQVAIDKPSPLSADFTESYFMELYTSCSPKISVKAFLATEQRIPGLGNGVLQDILFEAKLHPKRKLTTLSKTEISSLYYSIKKVLQAMYEQGGRDTEKDIFGNIGKYQTLLSNKTYKEPCPICNGEIIKKAYLGGSVYYCPTCQQE